MMLYAIMILNASLLIFKEQVTYNYVALHCCELHMHMHVRL